MRELKHEVAEQAAFREILEDIFADRPNNGDLLAIKVEDRARLAESPDIRSVWNQCQEIASLIDEIIVSSDLEHKPEDFVKSIADIQGMVDKVVRETQKVIQGEATGARTHFMAFIVNRIGPCYSHVHAFTAGIYTNEEMFAHLAEIKKSLEW